MVASKIESRGVTRVILCTGTRRECYDCNNKDINKLEHNEAKTSCEKVRNPGREGRVTKSSTGLARRRRRILHQDDIRHGQPCDVPLDGRSSHTRAFNILCHRE
jgi:hypothetical protein